MLRPDQLQRALASYEVQVLPVRADRGASQPGPRVHPASRRQPPAACGLGRRRDGPHSQDRGLRHEQPPGVALGLRGTRVPSVLRRRVLLEAGAAGCHGGRVRRRAVPRARRGRAARRPPAGPAGVPPGGLRAPVHPGPAPARLRRDPGRLRRRLEPAVAFREHQFPRTPGGRSDRQAPPPSATRRGAGTIWGWSPASPGARRGRTWRCSASSRDPRCTRSPGRSQARQELSAPRARP